MHERERECVAIGFHRRQLTGEPNSADGHHPHNLPRFCHSPASLLTIDVCPMFPSQSLALRPFRSWPERHSHEEMAHAAALEMDTEFDSVSFRALSWALQRLCHWEAMLGLATSVQLWTSKQKFVQLRDRMHAVGVSVSALDIDAEQFYQKSRVQRDSCSTSERIKARSRANSQLNYVFQTHSRTKSI